MSPPRKGSRSVYRFEGRVLPPGKNVAEREVHHNEFTPDQMKEIKLDGKPIVYNHLYTKDVIDSHQKRTENGFKIGRIIRNWIDSEGWMCIEGEIDNPETLTSRSIISEISHGLRTGLSLTHTYGLEPRIGNEPGYFEYKIFTEVSICPPDQIRRNECLIQKGEIIEIEEREGISELSRVSSSEKADSTTSTMDPKDQAKFELELEQEKKARKALEEDLKSFTEGARKKDADFESLQTQLSDKEAQTVKMQSELEQFFDRDRVQLNDKKSELMKMFGMGTEDTNNTVLDQAIGLANDQHGVETMGNLFTLVANNMREGGREHDESQVREFKHELTAAEDTQNYIAENRKRFRPEDGNSSSSSSSDYTVSKRDLAVMKAIENARNSRRG